VGGIPERPGYAVEVQRMGRLGVLNLAPESIQRGARHKIWNVYDRADDATRLRDNLSERFPLDRVIVRLAGSAS